MRRQPPPLQHVRRSYGDAGSAASGRAIEPIFGRIALFAGRTFWPSDLGIDIAHVGKEGHQIANEDYEKHRRFYSKLHELAGSGFGYSFIDDGYIYPGVRICRVDPPGATHALYQPR